MECGDATGITVGVAGAVAPARISLPNTTAKTFGRSDRFSNRLQNIALLREAGVASQRNAQGDGRLAQRYVFKDLVSGRLLWQGRFWWPFVAPVLTSDAHEGALFGRQFLHCVGPLFMIGNVSTLGAEPFLQVGMPANIGVEKRFSKFHG